MKKLCCLIAVCLMLGGCASVDTFETLGQVDHEPQTEAIMGKVCLTLPDSSASETLGGADGTMYLCDDYMLIVQTLLGGDLTATVKQISGFLPENVNIIESGTDACRRYEWVWTAIDDEDAERICRAAVLDDGNYHYCLCAIAPAARVGALAEQWTQVFRSFTLEL